MLAWSNGLGYTPFDMSFTASPAKQKVRDIITKEVDLMNQNLDNVSFVTLTDKDTTHEQAISDLGVDEILCINKNKDIIDWIKYDFEDHGSSLYQARAVRADINNWVQMSPRHINSFIWFDFCGLACAWNDWLNAMHQSRFCPNTTIAVTFCASLRGNGGTEWLKNFKSASGRTDDKVFLKNNISEEQIKKLSADKLCTKIYAQVLMDVIRRELEFTGGHDYDSFVCTKALAYTNQGATMFTLVFKNASPETLLHCSRSNRKEVEKLTFIEDNPVLKLSPKVSTENAIKIYQYAQTELGLKAKDLTHIANTYLNGCGKLAHLTRKSQGATVSTE